MAYKDLREWITQVDAAGELVRLEGVHWDLEASAVCSMTEKAVLFDKFPGYPPGYRLLGRGRKEGLKRFFITANWSSEARGIALTRAWKDRLKELKPVPPQAVTGGPIKENILTGKDINVLKFPVPRAFDREAGRYIGTHHAVITRDPETGRVNLGTYRMQVHDEKTLGIHASEGKDGRIIMEKYHQMGKPCPIVAVVGLDAGLFNASQFHLSHLEGLTELDFAGWIKGRPEEVFPGQYTGLPVPAHAEIAIEGEIPPGKKRMEGPFVEWCGYSQAKEFPYVDVKTVYHRNDPILTAFIGREVKPPGQAGAFPDFQKSALIWLQLEKAGIREVRGVGVHGYRMIVVSIKNLYAGHSRQAGMIAAQCHAGAYGTSYIVVVDDDIDPTNLHDVMWAVVGRTEPRRAIHILDYSWASHLTMLDPAQVQKAEYAMCPERATYQTQAIIDACRPLEWSPSWHQDAYVNPELKKKVKEKWGHLL